MTGVLEELSRYSKSRLAIEEEMMWSKLNTVVALTAQALLVSVAAFGDSGFLIESVGQATGSTCQAYALAVALATKKDAAFRIQTAADLRKVETGIRAEIKKQAGESDVLHSHIESGFGHYTGGKYHLKFKEVREADIGNVVRKVTGITSAAAVPPTFLLGTVAKDVILASATKIGPDSYNEGHIFTIYGVDGPANSNRRYLILNSGVRVKGKRFTCVQGLPDDPGDYSASLSWKNSAAIAFKTLDGNKVKLWTVERAN